MVIGWQRRSFDFQKGQSTLTVQLWQVSKAQTNPKVLIVSQQVEPKHPSLPRRLDFSPDGHLLAVGYLEQGVGKVALFTFPDGHRLKTITMGKSISPPFVTFAPNGRLAVVQHFESYSQLWFVRVDGGKEMPIKLQAQIPALAEGIAFSPDGHWMVVLQGGTARLYDAKGHFVRQIQSTPPLVRTAVFSKDGQRLPAFNTQRALCGYRKGNCRSLTCDMVSPSGKRAIGVWFGQRH
jgi:FOG: WD40 repeat